MKTCRKCKETKEVAQFYKQKTALQIEEAMIKHYKTDVTGCNHL